MAGILAVKVEIPLFRYFVPPPDFFKVRRGPCLGESYQQKLVAGLEVALAARGHDGELLQGGLVDHHRHQLQAEQADGDADGRVEENAGLVEDGEEEGDQDDADDGDVDKEDGDLQFERLAKVLPNVLQHKIEGEVDARQDDDGVGKAGSGAFLLADVNKGGEPVENVERLSSKKKKCQQIVPKKRNVHKKRNANKEYEKRDKPKVRKDVEG